MLPLDGPTRGKDQGASARYSTSMTTTHAESRGEVTQTNWARVLLGVGLGALAAYHQFKLPPVQPLLLDLYGYDRMVAGGFMSIYAAVGLLVSAALGVGLQKRGMRPFVAAAAGLFVLGSVITLSAPQWGLLVLLARGLEGFAFAVMAVAAPVIAMGNAAPRHMAFAMAIFATWIPAGQLIAIGLARPIVEAEMWRPLWWIGIAATAVVTGAAWRALGAPSAKRAESQPVRLATATPLQRRALLVTAAVFTLWSTEIFVMLTWLPQYLVEARGLDAAGAVLPYGIPVLLILIFNLVGGPLLRWGLPLAPLLATGLALQGVVWLLLPHLGSTAAGVAALIVFGIGGGITPTCLFAAPAAILGHRNAGGAAFGIIMTGRNVGVLIGPILLPPVLLATGGWNAIGPVFGGIALVAALGALGLHAMLQRIAACQPQATSR